MKSTIIKKLAMSQCVVGLGLFIVTAFLGIHLISRIAGLSRGFAEDSRQAAQELANITNLIVQLDASVQQVQEAVSNSVLTVYAAKQTITDVLNTASNTVEGVVAITRNLGKWATDFSVPCDLRTKWTSVDLKMTTVSFPSGVEIVKCTPLVNIGTGITDYSEKTKSILLDLARLQTSSRDTCDAGDRALSSVMVLCDIFRGSTLKDLHARIAIESERLRETGDVLDTVRWGVWYSLIVGIVVSSALVINGLCLYGIATATAGELHNNDRKAEVDHARV